MAWRPMRIIFKPYGLKGRDSAAEGNAYWRAATDFPASKNGKPLYGKGIDKESAFSNLMSWCPAQLKEKLAKLKPENIFPMPDQDGFAWYQINLDGSKPTREQWLYERQYWNTFHKLPYYD